MSGRLELGSSKVSASSLREQAARTILRNVRSQGHPYVELREDGKKFIYFCTLCLAPCYSDTVLFDHLKGNLHTERLSAAKVTLLGPNPWPFNDGVLFFDNSKENGKQSALPCSNRLLEFHDNDDNLAIVRYDQHLDTSRNLEVDGIQRCEKIFPEKVHSENGDSVFIIPKVLIRDEVCDVKVRNVGSGKIAARFFERDSVSNGIGRIWCEWLGKKDPIEEDVEVPEHDFAIIIFSYNYDIGRKGMLDEVKCLLSSSPTEESENGEGRNCKRKKSFSDPEDISESLSKEYDSSGEDSTMSNGTVTSQRLLLDRYENQLLDTRFISNKAIRKELRRQQRLAAEKMCDICQQKMLPGKDVATLFNLNTGRLACHSRNETGAFHVFHSSCLIHWILLRELDIITNDLVGPKVGKRSKRKTGANSKDMGRGVMKSRTQMKTVFCPECQGTGVMIEGDELEHPCYPLSEMFKFKIRVSDGRRAWMKAPELLQNCSTGFCFPSQSEEIKESVRPIKMLRFYRVDA